MTSSAAWTETWIGNSVALAMSALSIYEFFIALDLEVTTAWQRKKTVPVVLLLTIRWCMLADGILTFVPARSFEVCMVFAALSTAFYFAGFVQTALFSALRVYALADRSFLLSAVVFVFSLVPLGVDVYRDAHYTCEASGGTYSLDLLNIMARCTVIAADVIVLLVTWRKTFHQWRSGNRLDLSLPVTTCLMRDGTTHFLILLVMNILNLVGVITQEWQILGLNPMISYLPPILISRFLLNLRDCTNDCAAGTSLPPLSRSSVVFAAPSVLGNIGAPLHCSCDDEISYAIDPYEQDDDGGLTDMISMRSSAMPDI